MKCIAPWQVWWANFDPQIGHEQAGRRPAIIVGTALACSIPNELALVIPCTRTDRHLRWQPPVSLNGQQSFAMCDQIKSISLNRLVNRHPANSITPAERTTIAEVLARLIQVK